MTRGGNDTLTREVGDTICYGDAFGDCTWAMYHRRR